MGRPLLTPSQELKLLRVLLFKQTPPQPPTTPNSSKLTPTKLVNNSPTVHHTQHSPQHPPQVTNLASQHPTQLQASLKPSTPPVATLGRPCPPGPTHNSTLGQLLPMDNHHRLAKLMVVFPRLVLSTHNVAMGCTGISSSTRCVGYLFFCATVTCIPQPYYCESALN